MSSCRVAAAFTACSLLAFVTANTKPFFPYDTARITVPENADVDLYIVTVPAATDRESDPVTYNITSGDPDNSFYLAGATGRDVYTSITFDFESPDVEFDFIVSVFDPAGLSDPFNVVVFVSDANDAPVITSGQTATTKEMDPKDTAIYTLTFTDQDAGDSHSFSVPVLEGVPFFIPDPDEPQLVLLSEVDFETADTLFIEVNITVTDDGSPPLSDSVSVFVQVLDVNDRPVLTSPTTAAARELDVAGTHVYTATSTDEDPSDSHTYSLAVDGNSNNGVPAFAIDETTGNLTLASALDFELGPISYDIVVIVTDDAATAGGFPLSAALDVHIDVSDQNDAPTLTAGNITIEENLEVGVQIGTLTATDPDPADSFTFVIVGGNNNTAANQEAFTLVPATGALHVASHLNFEAGPVLYFLTISVTDDATCCGGSGPLTVLGTIVVNVTDVNDQPQPAGGAKFFVLENSPVETIIGTFDFFDEDPLDQVTWLIIPGGANDNKGSPAVSLDEATGDLKVASLLDYESSPLNYTVVVRLTDTGTSGPPLSNTVSIIVHLVDVNDAPVLVSPPAFSFQENLPTGSLVYNLTAADEDVLDTVAFVLVNATSNLGEAPLHVNASTGDITTASEFDFEASPTTLALIVATMDDATAGGPPITTYWSLTATLVDVNDPPTMTSTRAFNLTEHAVVGASVHTVTSFDQDVLDTVTFAIVGGNDNGGSPAFEVDRDTGAVTLASGMDFEVTPQAYGLEVMLVDDGTAGPAALNATFVVNVTVLDVNDAPVLSSVPSFDVLENTGVGVLLQTMASFDQDPLDTVTFAITGGNSYFGGPAFAVNASSGAVTVATALNFELLAPPFFLLDVLLADDGTAGPAPLNTSVTINATVVNANDAPVLTNAASFSFAENLAVGTPVFTLTSTDEDTADSHAYFINGGADNGAVPALAVNASTGTVFVASALDFEASVLTYALSVAVYDDASVRAPMRNDTMTVTASVVDVNEPPLLVSAPGFNFSENLPLGTLVYVAAAFDVDAGDSVSFAIVGGNDNDGVPAFAVHPATGELRLASYHNFEVSPTSYALVVALMDVGPAGPTPLTTTHTLNVTLTDVNEPPLFNQSVAAVAYTPENDVGWGSVIFTLPLPTDPDDPAGNLIQYTIVAGNDAGNFHLDHNNVTVTPGADLDFEDSGKNVFTLSILSNDPLTTGDNFTLGVLVTNVNEVPAFTSPPSVTVVENTAVGTLVYAATWFDIDAGDVHSVTIAGATHAHNGTVFAVDAATGTLTVAGLVNFEDAPATYALRLVVTDFDGLQDVLDVAVTVVDVNDVPRLADGDSATVLVPENWRHPPHETASRQMSDVVHFVKLFDEDGNDMTIRHVGGVNTNAAGDTVFVVHHLNATAGMVDMNPALDEFTGNLDFEGSDPNPYTLDLMVVDDGSPPAVFNVTLTLIIGDENDTPTRWSFNTFTGEENSATTRVLYDFQLEDEDHAGFGDFGTYRITGGDPEGDFRIDATRGWIFFAHNVDYEGEGQAREWLLEIEVTDNLPPHHTTVFELPCQLVDTNDPPRVTSPGVAPVLEDHPLGVPFYNFTYFEEDDGDVATWEIVSGNLVSEGSGGFGTVFDPFTVLPYLVITPEDAAPFAIDAASGQLFLSSEFAPFSTIDYESGPHTFALVVRATARSTTGRLPLFAHTDFDLRVDVMEVNEGVIFRPREDSVETADHGLPGLFVYRLPEPYEQDHPHVLNVTYSIAGGNDGTFGIQEQDGLSMVLEVVAPPTTLFTQTHYVLLLRATDKLGAYADMPLSVTVLKTTVFTPAADTVCYHGIPCPVWFLPSLRAAATTFKIDLRQGGGDPVDVFGEPYNGLIGVFERDSPGMEDFNRTLNYTAFVPSFDLAEGGYAVRVTSPSEGFDASDGTSAEFQLRYPYRWLAGPWGACDTGEYPCGVGLATRPVVCADNRGPEFRAPGAAPNTTFNLTSFADDGTPTHALMDVYYAEEALCGSYTPRELPTRRCVEFCGVNDTSLPVPVEAKGDAAVISQTLAQCDVECGGGSREVTPSCWVRDVGEVALADCPLPVPTVEPCNEAPCLHHARVQGFTHCDDQCGTGYAFQTVDCVDPLGFAAPLPQCGFVEDTLAAMWPAEVSNTSALVQACGTEACEEFRYKWRRFGECNEACSASAVVDATFPGAPQRFRDVDCLLDNDKVVFDDFCDDLLVPRPTEVATCNTYPCERFAFEFGEWTSCDTTCGTGVRSRTVDCRASNGTLVGDLWACAGALNGAWRNILPPTTRVCEADSGCSQECTADEDCPGGNADGTGNGFCFGVVCRCRKSFSGPACSIRDPIPLAFCDGFRDGEGNCCEGVVGPGDVCCGSPDAVLDRDGRCCFAALDVCGVCNGTAVAIDIHQQCCDTPLAANGICCDGGAMDDCGVCDGDNRCQWVGTVSLDLQPPNFEGEGDPVLDLTSAANFRFDTALGEYLEGVLLLPDDSVEVGTLTPTSRRRRRLEGGAPRRAQAAVTVDVQLRVRNMPLTSGSIAGGIQLQRGLELLGADGLPGAVVNHVVTYFREPGVCGDGVCERGEQCTDLTCSNAGGCQQDCPHAVLVCQAPSEGEPMCSGHGVCVSSSGTCECYGGYDGPTCSECAPLHGRLVATPTVTGPCIKRPAEGCGDGVLNSNEDDIDCGRGCEVACNVSPPWDRPPLPALPGPGPDVGLIALGVFVAVVALATVPCYIYVWPGVKARGVATWRAHKSRKAAMKTVESSAAEDDDTVLSLKAPRVTAADILAQLEVDAERYERRKHRQQKRSGGTPTHARVVPLSQLYDGPDNEPIIRDRILAKHMTPQAAAYRESKAAPLAQAMVSLDAPELPPGRDALGRPVRAHHVPRVVKHLGEVVPQPDAVLRDPSAVPLPPSSAVVVGDEDAAPDAGAVAAVRRQQAVDNMMSPELRHMLRAGSSSPQSSPRSSSGSFGGGGLPAGSPQEAGLTMGSPRPGGLLVGSPLAPARSGSVSHSFVMRSSPLRPKGLPSRPSARSVPRAWSGLSLPLPAVKGEDLGVGEDGVEEVEVVEAEELELGGESPTLDAEGSIEEVALGDGSVRDGSERDGSERGGSVCSDGASPVGGGASPVGDGADSVASTGSGRAVLLPDAQGGVDWGQLALQSGRSTVSRDASDFLGGVAAVDLPAVGSSRHASPRSQASSSSSSKSRTSRTSSRRRHRSRTNSVASTASTNVTEQLLMEKAARRGRPAAVAESSFYRHASPMSPVTVKDMAAALGPIQRDAGPRHMNPVGQSDDRTASILSRARHVARHGTDPMLYRHGLEDGTKYSYTGRQPPRVMAPPDGYPKRQAVASPSGVTLEAVMEAAVGDTSTAVGSKLRDEAAQAYLEKFGRRPF